MLRLSSLFSDHAVIRHSIPFPVWGFGAKADAMVTVTFGKIQRHTKADALGRFKLYMPPCPPGPAPDLVVESEGEKITVTDIAAGEVLLASGQSNMSFTVKTMGEELRKEYTDHADTFADVRHITVDRVADARGRDEFSGDWQLATAETMLEWSAIAIAAARELAKSSGHVVGVLNSSWGGTPAEAWISRETLSSVPSFDSLLAEYERHLGTDADWSFEEKPKYSTEEGAERKFGPPPFDCPPGKLDPDKWQFCNVPVKWDALEINAASVVAFRHKLCIPDSWAGCDLILEPGMMEQQDVCSFNGVEIGRTGKGYDYMCFTDLRRYKVPAKLVKAGQVNVIQERNFCYIWIGGINGPADKMRIYPEGREDEAISIAGLWEYQVERWGKRIPYGHNIDELTPRAPQSMNILFDSMIRPILGYPVTAALWYQGENNCSRKNEPYDELMAALIREWRSRWGCGNFPFVQVILAGHGTVEHFNPAAPICSVRQMQINAAKMTGTSVVSAVDCGDPQDIHPHRKMKVGIRAGQQLIVDLGWEQPLLSPELKGTYPLDGKLYLAIAHGAKLTTADGKEPGSFMVAGVDCQFRDARAELGDGFIILSSAEVPHPVYAAYSYGADPEMANVCNKAGLPLLPFKTR